MNVDDEDTQLGEEGKGTRCVSPLPPEGRLAFSVPHKAGHEARAGADGAACTVGQRLPPQRKREGGGGDLSSSSFRFNHSAAL